MGMNFMELLQLIKNGNNPQQLIMHFLQQSGKGNPIFENAINLATKGDSSALEQVARNLAKQRGLDFDKEFANFQNYLK